MNYLGDIVQGGTVRCVWNSKAANGASITRATNGSIRVYKNSSTTERSSSAGIADTEDFDTLTGVHHINIDTSNNTDAGFYAAGNDYFIVLQGATIDGQSVNEVLGQFSIENRNGAGVASTQSMGCAVVESCEVLRGATSQTLYFTVLDRHGKEKTGLTYSDFTAYYGRMRESPTGIVLTDLDGAYSNPWISGLFGDMSPTGFKGYRLDVPDAAFASTNSADKVIIQLVGPSDCRISVKEVSLVAWDKQTPLSSSTLGTVTSLTNKTGFSLASTGLDAISVTAPTTVATTFPGMMVQLWRRFFKKSTLTSTELKTYADNGSTVVTTQAVSDTGGTQTQGAAS